MLTDYVINVYRFMIRLVVCVMY